MNILLINGCEENDSLGNDYVKELCCYIENSKYTYKLAALHSLSLKPCTSCDYCQVKKPGICAINDGLNEILKDFMRADTAVIITPIQFGTCNSITKTFMDRTQPLFLPYQKLKSNVMKNRYKKYPYIVFVGISKEESPQSIANFKNTMLNSTLSLSSHKKNIEIISAKSDINFNFL